MNYDLNIPRSKIIGHIYEENHENANIIRSPEQILWHIGNDIMEEVALSKLPSNLRRLHTSGKVHFHDLSSLPYRSMNCVAGSTNILCKFGDSYVLKTIEDLYENYKDHLNSLEVCTYNHETKTAEFKPINVLLKQPKGKLYRVTFTNGAWIDVTSDHAFYNYVNGNKKRGNYPYISPNTCEVKNLEEGKNIGNINFFENISTLRADPFDKLVGFF